MTRKTFFELMGISITASATICNLDSCKKNELTSTDKIDFTIDLTDPLYSKLLQIDNFIFINKSIDIIIAHTKNDEFVAVAARCTHQGSLVAYYPSDIFFCSKHGATFDTKGNVKVGPAVNPLRLFKTKLTGNKLRIYS